MAFSVHTLKGSAANLGATELVAACRTLESSPGAPVAQALEPLLVALERHVAEAQAELVLLAAAG
jgi:HPt (histidine-containing phosphotransfer) domain-containing protein